MNKNLSILGSTGSIGTQALDVCRAHNFKVSGLSALGNIKLIEQQTREFKPTTICIFDKSKYKELKENLKDIDVKITTGVEGLCEVASLSEIDTVLNSVVGMIGLTPTLAGIDAKKDIALANKETLVTGGKLVIDRAKQKGVQILPVDSEHSAIFQALQGNEQNKIKKIFLTASGGPFYGKTREELANVGVKDALKHPNWSMGAKITIDSASLMNKGLEFIEAMWLFDLSPEQIEVVVHRESVVHSAVEYEDNSVIAQMGVPDMKIPIQYALTYPHRYSCNVKALSLFDYGKLTFSKADKETFVCLKACIEAITKGGLMPTVVNGANEQAVELFLQEKISFLQIGDVVYQALQHFSKSQEELTLTLENIINIDKKAREYTRAYVADKV